MTETEAQLRERVAALEDRELARMLTLDADDYRVEALRIAQAEARARNLDIESLGAELRREGRARIEGPGPVSLLQVQRIDWASLAPIWPWLFFVGGAFALELVLVMQEKTQDHAWMRSLLIPAIGSLVYYLIAVHRLVSALQRATSGGFPITPMTAVGFHFIPLLNFVWPFQWGSAVARFAETNGKGLAIDRYVPGVLFLISLALLRVDTAARTLVLGLVVVYPQLRLRSSMRRARLEREPDADWSSGGPR